MKLGKKRVQSKKKFVCLIESTKKKTPSSWQILDYLTTMSSPVLGATWAQLTDE